MSRVSGEVMRKKVEIWFSAQETGICPQCTKFADCHILKAMKKSLEHEVRPTYDNVMELVVYMCPEFVEAENEVS
jgi:hypothetical protein